MDNNSMSNNFFFLVFDGWWINKKWQIAKVINKQAKEQMKQEQFPGHPISHNWHFVPKLSFIIICCCTSISFSCFIIIIVAYFFFLFRATKRFNTSLFLFVVIFPQSILLLNTPFFYFFIFYYFRVAFYPIKRSNKCQVSSSGVFYDNIRRKIIHLPWLMTLLRIFCFFICRYFFALHPLSRLHSHWLQNHGHVFLLVTWALGAIYAYFPLQYTSIVEIIVVSTVETSSEADSFSSNNTDIPVPVTSTTSYYQCSYRENGLSANQRRLFLISNFFLTFALPCLTLAFSYISIIRKLLIDQRRILASMNSTPVMYSGGAGGSLGNGNGNSNSGSLSGSGSGRNSRMFSHIGVGTIGGFGSSSKVKIRLPSPTVRRIHKRQLNYIQTRLKVTKTRVFLKHFYNVFSVIRPFASCSPSSFFTVLVGCQSKCTNFCTSTTWFVSVQRGSFLP